MSRNSSTPPEIPKKDIKQEKPDTDQCGSGQIENEETKDVKNLAELKIKEPQETLEQAQKEIAALRQQLRPEHLQGIIALGELRPEHLQGIIALGELRQEQQLRPEHLQGIIALGELRQEHLQGIIALGELRLLQGSVLSVPRPTDDAIDGNVAEARELEELLNRSRFLHPVLIPVFDTRGITCFVNLPGDGQQCAAQNCPYKWSDTRCDCHLTNIVFLVQCKLCKKAYDNTRLGRQKEATKENHPFPYEYSGEDNGIFIGYCSDRPQASVRFNEMLTSPNQALHKHWAEVHRPPPLEVRTTDLSYRFIALYKGIFPLHVRERMKILFEPSIRG